MIHAISDRSDEFDSTMYRQRARTCLLYLMEENSRAQRRDATGVLIVLHYEVEISGRLFTAVK